MQFLWAEASIVQTISLELSGMSFVDLAFRPQG